MISASPVPVALSVIPKPVSVDRQEGAFRLTPETRIVAPVGLRETGQYLQSVLRPSTGLPLEIEAGQGGKKGSITLVLDPKLEELGPEGYRLFVGKDRAEIRAFSAAGVFYGVQTFRQMLPVESFGSTRATGIAWSVPCVRIEDKPHFVWRGMHLDVARHFMPKEGVLKFLDLMALHKLNTFHWHLTDDQGWRIEIKRYPKLTEVGAFREDTMLTYEPPTFEGQPHGGFYTQVEVKEIVAYAAARHITVVPEIEMPGHAQAAIAAYPELGNTEKTLEVGTSWGVIPDVFNVDESTQTFLKGVLTEVLALFPSRYIHLGGDEVPKEQWKASEKAQAKMRALGLSDENELQSWFVRQMDRYLAARGRRLVGWDEILEGGLAPGATVMSWRGTEGGIAAAKAGHDVVMASNSHLYFDHYQSEHREKEPHAIGGFLSLERVYEFDPVPAELDAEEAKHILGTQAQIWTEYIADMDRVEYMAFPRECALAEVAWSPSEGREFAEFRGRLETHLERLRTLGVNFRPLD